MFIQMLGSVGICILAGAANAVHVTEGSFEDAGGTHW
jgi:hypothetical protein